VELSDTAFFPQQAYQCGPAALATVLHSSGVSVQPDTLARQVYLPARQGTLQTELVGATRRAARIPYTIAPDLRALRDELDAGRPVLVLQNLGIALLPVWHYAVVVGLLPDTDQVVLRSGTVRRHVIAADEFLRSWQLADNWAMVVVRPGALPAQVDPDRYLKAVALSERYLQPKDRVAAYKAVLERWPDNPTARFGLAYAFHDAGDLTAATSAYLELIEENPGHVVAYNNVADVLRRRGCNVGAREAARKALSIARSDHPALLEDIQATLAEIPDGADALSCQ
jgi:tetratricopeptide (TPR) repeat protein